MLLKLAFQNIRKSIRDYAIYFFTLVLGVAIFYVFNALGSQAAMMELSESTMDIIELMTEILSIVSVFIACVLGFLIVYASRFLMKRRSKEFGTYLLLGMSKRKVSMILFFETLMIGMLSLGVGLGLGVIVSQLVSVVVLDMFEADMTKFRFVFSEEGCVRTVLYFGVMYLVMMIFNTVNISKCKLITLLTESKKGEKQKLKNPILCVVVFLLSAAVLSYAYYLVTGGLTGDASEEQVLLATALGAVSTFFIFWSLSGLILRFGQAVGRFYYKGLNTFTLKQFSSQINTTVFSMTIICLMLFVTIVALSSCMALKNSMNEGIKKFAPVDLQIVDWKREILIEQENTQTENGEKETVLAQLDVITKVETVGIDLRKYLQDYVTVGVYSDPNLTLETMLGNLDDEVLARFPFLRYDTPETIMTVTDYNKIAEYYGIPTYEVGDDEYIVVANYEGAVGARNLALAAGTKIMVFGKVLEPKNTECVDGFVEIGAQNMNTGIVVVPDDVVAREGADYEMLAGRYNTTDKSEIQKLEDQLEALPDNPPLVFITTKTDIRQSVVGVTAIVTFVGLYLGLIFLTSVATILALKELSESSDNRSRYGILRKIGVDEKWINKALFVQIGVYFMLPLLVAILHSVFGIGFVMRIMPLFGKNELLPSIIMTGMFLVVIYGGYFLVTYYCSRNIIRERR